MAIATVTSKGQVTIPKEIRERLGIVTGDELDFEVADGTLFVTRRAKARLEDLCGIIKRPGKRAVSVEAMNEAVLDSVVESFKR